MTSADASRLAGRGKTAIVSGKEMDADQAAALHEVKDIFGKLAKALKQILLYRHNKERYGEYLQDTYSAFADYLQRRGQMMLRVQPTGYMMGGVDVYTDENRDNNLCYPFYAHGVRMIIINPGLTLDELIRFLNLIFSASDKGVRQSEDFVTRLWKAELQAIQYIVVEGFKAVEDEDAEEVQMEVDKVVAYLYRQLQSNTDDVARFARVDTADLDLKLQEVDQVRGNVIQGETATAADKDRIKRALHEEENQKLLPKMVVILFQLLELCTDQKNFEDVAESFLQLLDAMLFSERFDVIQQILERFDVSKKKNLREGVPELVQAAQDRFLLKMGEPQRLSALTQMFNAGPVKNLEGVRTYLMNLSSDALEPLLDCLERVEVANNRRVLCDVIAELAKTYPDRVANRLSHPSSQVVKDMIYILDKIDPPNKLSLIAGLLEHSSVVLRLETINTLGRNPSDETLPYIIKCLKGNDPQMRAAAARVMPFFAPERAATELLHQAAAADFAKRPKDEQRALLSSICLVQHPRCQQYVANILGAKGNLLTRTKVDEAKMQIIEAMATVVSIPMLQQLAAIVQDATQSKELQLAARNAALEMRNKLMGGQPAAPRPAG
ncbi:MAG: HEAT repeat domain-containing protein [Deltaproteobacteria bacterium]|nr:HEAT repeat domain-containing protein [Deltaproteobacteria bacterium]